MTDKTAPLLIKRYASRRLYNTETSDYVTLEDIAAFIHAGREVKIVDLKSGDDLTRQYLLQIVAEHESRGENVLPLEVLTDLVRSYTSQAQSVVPQFLAMSFEMLRDGRFVIVLNRQSIACCPYAAKGDRELIAVSRFACFANRHHNAPPICVFPGDCGFDERGVGNGQSDGFGVFIVACAGDIDGYEFGCAFAIPHDLVGEVEHDAPQGAIKLSVAPDIHARGTCGRTN